MSAAEGLSTPLLTCEAVLSETAFHLGSSSRALELIETGLLTINFTCSDHVAQLKRSRSGMWTANRTLRTYA